jgi:hypothetical protein
MNDDSDFETLAPLVDLIRSAALPRDLIRTLEPELFAARVVALATANGMPLLPLSHACMVLHDFAMDGSGLPAMSVHVARECAVWLTLNKPGTYRVTVDKGQWKLTRSALATAS